MSQEEAACARLLAYATTTLSYLHAWMAALKLENAVTQPLWQFCLLSYRPSTF